MSYDDPDNPSPAPGGRPPRRRGALVAVAALVPAGLAGWLLWQAMSGSGDGDPQQLRPSSGQSSPSSPSSAQGGAGGGDDKSAPSGSKPVGSSGPADPDPSKSSSAPKPPRDGALKGKTVVIDPGHNPNNRNHPQEISRLVDIGTNKKECDTTGTSTNNGYSEAEFTLDVAHRLRTLLEKQGATVKFTQDGDRAYGPCVDERARIGNTADADAVVSIHADGSGEGNRGFHVIMPAKVDAGSADTTAIAGPSRDLGERIAGGFVRSTGTAPSNYIGGGTGLDVRDDLGGLNLSKVPKVFIECGNMRDAKDEALLTSGTWRQKAAQGISDGIEGFLAP
ncbi:N-acetylmuramoyl-L-alanine amidase [Streptomyces monticola]|uniref:N-acetylmuramoyl-L-alanine amidase n=1 Tax=Streptomyces monticola TaxID=2666263 RepID=A0ABW2JSA4_9ACTN